MEKQLLTIREAAELLGISIDTLRRWDESGKLPAIRAGEGSHRHYNKNDLELFINDLFNLAKKWAFNPTPIELDPSFYCPNSSIFQAKLTKMQNVLEKVPHIKDIYSLLVAIAGEIGNNSFDHNLGNWPDIVGIFFAYDARKNTIVLADRGQGILATLHRVRPSLVTHQEALNVAFTEKITGRAPENRGNGLKFVRQVISDNPFSLKFQTGNAKLEIKSYNNDLLNSTAEENFHGCIALIKFNKIK
jgi:excisionase family DNA binding protein